MLVAIVAITEGLVLAGVSWRARQHATMRKAIAIFNMMISRGIVSGDRV